MGEIHDGGTRIGGIDADGVWGGGEREADLVIRCELGVDELMDSLF
jgi:hypothetical protein